MSYSCAAVDKVSTDLKYFYTGSGAARHCTAGYVRRRTWCERGDPWALHAMTYGAESGVGEALECRAISPRLLGCELLPVILNGHLMWILTY